MIIDFLFGQFMALLSWLFGFLPTATLPSGVISFLGVIKNGIELIAIMLPMSTLLTIFNLVLFIEATILIYRIVNEVIKKLRGSG
jgi:hypothetical protein